ncbi:hypothetical protein [Streptomyces bluensis]|uniref:Tn3 transposase DDE domain-containing protein n=1 Tax=Streptomyces bluensis TaxID=33897 RepID=A0ABW6UFT5_9ACTN
MRGRLGGADRARSLIAISEWITDAMQLLAAMDHHGVVLAQRHGRLQEQRDPLLRTLLDGLDPENSVVTAGALHTQHDHGAYLTGRGAHHQAGLDIVPPGLG